MRRRVTRTQWEQGKDHGRPCRFMAVRHRDPGRRRIRFSERITDLLPGPFPCLSLSFAVPRIVAYDELSQSAASAVSRWFAAGGNDHVSACRAVGIRAISQSTRSRSCARVLASNCLGVCDGALSPGATVRGSRRAAPGPGEEESRIVHAKDCRRCYWSGRWRLSGWICGRCTRRQALPVRRSRFERQDDRHPGRRGIWRHPRIAG